MKNCLIIILIFLIAHSINAQNKYLDGEWFAHYTELKQSGWASSSDLTYFIIKDSIIIERAIPNNDFTDSLSISYSKDSLFIGKSEKYKIIEQTDSSIRYESELFDYRWKRINKTLFDTTDFEKVIKLLNNNQIQFTNYGSTSNRPEFEITFSIINRNTTQDASILNQKCKTERSKLFPNSKESWSLELYDRSLFLIISTANGGGIIFIKQILENQIQGQMIDRKGKSIDVKLIKS